MVAGIGAAVAAAAAIAQAITSAYQAGGQSSEDNDIKDLQARVAAVEAQLREHRHKEHDPASREEHHAVDDLESITARANQLARGGDTRELASLEASLEQHLTQMGLVDTARLPRVPEKKSWFVKQMERKGAADWGY